MLEGYPGDNTHRQSNISQNWRRWNGLGMRIIWVEAETTRVHEISYRETTEGV